MEMKRELSYSEQARYVRATSLLTAYQRAMHPGLHGAASLSESIMGSIELLMERFMNTKRWQR